MRRWLGATLALGLCGAVACGPGLGLTPTEPTTCKKVAGTYVSSYGNSCGHFSNGDTAVVTQSGCKLTTTVPGVGALTGTVTGDTVDWKVDFGSDCKGTGTGAGKIDGTRITGTYSGLQSGSNCCSTIAGTFTLSLK